MAPASAPYRSHLIGVIIGVQAVVAINLVNRSTLASFEHTAEVIAGGADLQISNGSVGVPEALIETVAAVPGVTSVSGLVQGTVRTQWGALTLFGVDLVADQQIRQIQFPEEHVRIPDELGFVNATDSIAVSTSFAGQAGIELGSSFALVGPMGRDALVVRGFLDPVGPATLFGGAVALADLPTVQRIFGLGERVDQIDIKLAEHAPIESTKARIAAVIDGTGSVDAPRERGARESARCSEQFRQY